MVTCDQKDLAGLEKLRDSFFQKPETDESSLGHVLQPCTDGGNTSIHYAALSDFSEALDILAHVLSKQDRCNLWEASVKLLGQRNQNGDTPLMMLCINDFVQTLNGWIDYVIHMGILQGLEWEGIQLILIQTLRLEKFYKWD